MLLENQVAIVSGVGPGMGRDIALRFAREGANLALGARSADYLESVAKEVRALGRRAVARPTDISRLEDCARVVGRAEGERGGLNILVNNAYHPGRYELFEHADLERWREPLEVNLFGSLRLTQEVVPRMKRRGGGSVVFINSMIVREVLPTMASYAASKGALLAAAQGLARELRRRGRVILGGPGMGRTTVVNAAAERLRAQGIEVAVLELGDESAALGASHASVTLRTGGLALHREIARGRMPLVEKRAVQRVPLVLLLRRDLRARAAAAGFPLAEDELERAVPASGGHPPVFPALLQADPVPR